jgi:LPXTG-motif cell wall-anchored protein
VCTVCRYTETVKIPVTETDTEASEPSNPANEDTNKTGDNSNILLWIALMILSCGVLVITYKKKKQSN